MFSIIFIFKVKYEHYNELQCNYTFGQNYSERRIVIMPGEIKVGLGISFILVESLLFRYIKNS